MKLNINRPNISRFVCLMLIATIYLVVVSFIYFQLAPFADGADHAFRIKVFSEEGRIFSDDPIVKPLAGTLQEKINYPPGFYSQALMLNLLISDERITLAVLNTLPVLVMVFAMYHFFGSTGLLASLLLVCTPMIYWCCGHLLMEPMVFCVSILIYGYTTGVLSGEGWRRGNYLLLGSCYLLGFFLKTTIFPLVFISGCFVLGYLLVKRQFEIFFILTVQCLVLSLPVVVYSLQEYGFLTYSSVGPSLFTQYPFHPYWEKLSAADVRLINDSQYDLVSENLVQYDRNRLPTLAEHLKSRDILSILQLLSPVPLSARADRRWYGKAPIVAQQAFLFLLLLGLLLAIMGYKKRIKWLVILILATFLILVHRFLNQGLHRYTFYLQLVTSLIVVYPLSLFNKSFYSRRLSCLVLVLFSIYAISLLQTPLDLLPRYKYSLAHRIQGAHRGIEEIRSFMVEFGRELQAGEIYAPSGEFSYYLGRGVVKDKRLLTITAEKIRDYLVTSNIRFIILPSDYFKETLLLGGRKLPNLIKYWVGGSLPMDSGIYELIKTSELQLAAKYGSYRVYKVY